MEQESRKRREGPVQVGTKDIRFCFNLCGFLSFRVRVLIVLPTGCQFYHNCHLSVVVRDPLVVGK